MKRMTMFLCMLIASVQCVFSNIKDDELTAVYVWISGSSICYEFEQRPSISFSDGKAVLRLKNNQEPILVLPLNENGNLRITFGKYESSTSIEKVIELDNPENPSKKIITGGKLIIVKNGKFFDFQGVEIKAGIF